MNPEKIGEPEVAPPESVDLSMVPPAKGDIAGRLEKFDSAVKAETVPGSPTDTPVMELLNAELRKTIENEAVTPANAIYHEKDPYSKPEAGEAQGMDSLISDIKKEEVPPAAAEAVESAKEKPEDLMAEMEKIKPEVKELAALLTDKRMQERGKMDYATLTNNTDAYVAARSEDSEAYDSARKILQEPGLIDSIRKSWNGGDSLLKDTVNNVDLKKVIDFMWQSNVPMTGMNSNPWDRERSRPDFWKEGDPKSQAAAVEEIRDRKRRMNETTDNMLDKGMKQIITSPDDYVEAMWRGFRRSVDLSQQEMSKDGASNWEKNKAEEGIQYTYDRRPDMLAVGFGEAALLAGDVEVAAKSLAFADIVNPLSPEVVQSLKSGLEKLEPTAKKKFAEAYEKERKQERNYEWVGGPGGGYEVKTESEA